MPDFPNTTFEGLELYWSPVAAALLYPAAGAASAWTWDSATHPARLKRAARRVLVALRLLNLRRPLVTVVDLACATNAEYARAEVDALSRDQAWHDGEIALYAAPLSTGNRDWRGPRYAADMLSALIGPGPSALPNIGVAILSWEDLLDRVGSIPDQARRVAEVVGLRPGSQGPATEADIGDKLRDLAAAYAALDDEGAPPEASA